MDTTELEGNRTQLEQKNVRIKANKALGAYEISLAKGELPEPKWPKEPKTIKDALKIAFKDRIIDSIDHPVLKQLRGEQ